MDLLKIQQQFTELQPQCQWAANEGAKDCFNQGILFTVADVFRSQMEQNDIWLIGRRGIAGEKPRTWTHHSNHTLRLAFDIVMEKGTYDQAALIYAKYGIYRQPDLVKLGDIGHFNTLMAMPQPITYSANALIRRLTRLIAQAGPLFKASLQKRLDSLQNNDKSL